MVLGNFGFVELFIDFIFVGFWLGILVKKYLVFLLKFDYEYNKCKWKLLVYFVF